MAEWATSETITAAKLNQKELYVGSAAPGTTYAGMLWLDTDDNKLYQRNAANSAWLERPGLSLTHTVTGLWTFDRGANPPFAVAAGSTKVANLDADKVDGYNPGLGDGALAVLPSATEGQILRRGAAAWEVGNMKHVEIIEWHATQAGEATTDRLMWRKTIGASDTRLNAPEIANATALLVSNYWTAPKACTVKHAIAKITTAPSAGSVVCTVQKWSTGGAVTTITTLTIPISGFYNGSNPDIALAQGDSMLVRVLGNAGNPTAEVEVSIFVEFDV